MPKVNNILFLLMGALKTDARVKRHAVSLSKLQATKISCLHYSNHEQKIIFLTTFVAGEILTTKKIINPFHRSLAPILFHFVAFYYLLMGRFSIILGNDIHTSLIIYICSFFRNGNVYDTHEIWPELVRQKLPKTIAGLLLFFERQAITRSDMVIFPSKLRKKFITRYYGIHLVNHYISENVPSKLMHQNVIPDKYIDIEELKASKNTVVYTGVLAPDRGIDNLLSELRKLDASWHLLLVGMIRNLNLESMIVRYGLEKRVTYLGTVKSEQLGPLIRNCKVGYVHYSPDSVNNQLFASNKIWEYLIEGVPIVINDLIASKNMKETSGVFKYVDGEIHHAIKNAYYFEKSKVKFDISPWEKQCSDFNQKIISTVATLDKDFYNETDFN